MESISEIRNKLDEIKGYNLYNEGGLDYVINLYSDFSRDYTEDVRAGVIKLVKSAETQKTKLIREKERLSAMIEFEQKFYDKGYIAGIDEVGRGPLAGPIVTAAVVLPHGLMIPYVNDSKQLSEEKREELFDIIMDKAISVACGMHSERDIDDMGIAPADSDAMKMAALKLSVKPDFILVDAFPIKELDIEQYPIIKGDTKSISIAAASIVAKVTRDRLMVKLDEMYPGYGFAKNKGYGSAEHIEAIKTLGPCPAHRRSFIKNFV